MDAEDNKTKIKGNENKGATKIMSYDTTIGNTTITNFRESSTLNYAMITLVPINSHHNLALLVTTELLKAS
jgi:hypothetical protein